MVTGYQWVNFVVLFLLLDKVSVSSARPEAKSKGNNTIVKLLVSEEYSNKTKPRILTHPPNVDFYGQEQEIVFPDSIADRIDVPIRLGLPKCSSEGLPFCEEVETYPYTHIKRVLQRNTILKSLFGQDEAPEIASRLGDEDEKFVCRSVKQTIFPKMGETKNNKWKFIINQGDDEEGFVQGVQVEICKNPEGECDIPGNPMLNPGYTLTCKQKYVYRRLLSIDNKGEPVQDSFKMPSACCCAYKQNFDFLTRLGKSASTKAPKKEQATTVS
ncbi:protein spaetzle-like [Anthonomus grandis grandis]|uniref:protein spaetzle-like n=1 Tax=Anthonomus grandis grandis TaxID=2921223 RepID=UPI0021667659|nr:protein spaetzle-like [Anthonomus grandis grandis]